MADTPMLDRETLEAALEGLLLQREKLDLRIQHVRELLGVTPGEDGPKRRNLTPEARQRIVDAQKKRWDTFREGKSRRKGKGD